MTLRKFLLPLHLWTGLTIGLVFVAIAITGSLLAFRPQLERKLDAHLYIVPASDARLGNDELIARARAAHPAGKLENVRYYRDPTAPFLAYFSTKDYVHLNPHTGEVLGIRSRYGRGFGWIEGFHKFLQVDPAIGEPITGTLGFFYAGLLATGIILWWPASRRALKAGLTFNRKLSGRPWNLNLHKTLGFYASAILLVSALSGIPIALDFAKNALYVLTGSSETAAPAAEAMRPELPFAGFDALGRSVAGVFPNAGETYFLLTKKDLVSAYVIDAGAPHPNARSYVWLQASTGRVIKTLAYRDAGAGFHFYYWLMSLHTGLIGGLPVKLLLLFGALSVPVLAYSGAASYFRRRSKSAATPRAKPAISENVNVMSS